MKYFLYILLTITGCLAQPFTFQDLAFLGQGTNAATAPFSPSDVAGLVLWYKADGITNWWDGGSPTNGMMITNWTDFSTSGLSVTNAAANQQPYWTNNGSRLNGKPWLEFDGTDDRLWVNAGSWSQPNTLYIIFRTQQTDGDVKYLFDGNATSARNSMVVDTGFRLTFNAGTVVAASTNSITTGIWYLAHALYTSTSTDYIKTNGVTVKTGDPGSNPQTQVRIATTRVTSGSIWNGGIAEILFYNASLSTGSISNLNSYFTNKYGAYASW